MSEYPADGDRVSASRLCHRHRLRRPTGHRKSRGLTIHIDVNPQASWGCRSDEAAASSADHVRVACNDGPENPNCYPPRLAHPTKELHMTDMHRVRRFRWLVRQPP